MSEIFGVVGAGTMGNGIAQVAARAGFDVVLRDVGQEFLARIDRGAPSCLVLDVRLGEFTGFDLQDALLARGDVPPIIFITAHDEIPAFRLEPRAGTAGYLRKPFDMAALIALVRPWLRESATQAATG